MLWAVRPCASQKTIGLRAARSGASFYTKEIDYAGIPIKAPAVVQDAALLRAQQWLATILRYAPIIAANMRDEGCELHIIGKNQGTSDLPENRHWKGRKFDKDLSMDERTRGVGGLYASCGEENLLRLQPDRYADREICPHEFAHTLMEYGLDAPAQAAIKDQYQRALAAGRWRSAYAGTNEREYFAELSMWYFGSRGDYGKIVPEPRPGAKWLESYDRDGYLLLRSIYTGTRQIARKSSTILRAVSAHEEGTIRSLEGTVSTTIRFKNTRSTPVKLFWLDYEGKRKPYETIMPGCSAVQNTYVTHPFLLTDESGRGLVIFVGQREPGVAMVE